MRPQLFFGGLLVALMGAGFYLLSLPFVYFWSIPFGIAGLIMMAASLFLPETEGPLRPPEGFRFCPYCSTAVPLGAARCPHCNGVQPREG
ncbi:MAG: hypothetical protein JRN08_05265 [Nitrososphaerota archaeon]|nr:hypothetical protein [Nitrososphaerota archaeon]